MTTENRSRGLLLALLLACAPAPGAEVLLKEARVQVYFSPEGGAEAAVVAAVDQARSSVLVQAYQFTSAPIAGALRAARQRGVDVRVILDPSQRTERYSVLTFLTRAGIPTWIDATRAIAHDKVMILDGRRVVTGSFNFTKAAERRNGENLLILDAPVLADLYTRNWQAHLASAEPVH